MVMKTSPTCHFSTKLYLKFKIFLQFWIRIWFWPTPPPRWSKTILSRLKKKNLGPFPKVKIWKSSSKHEISLFRSKSTRTSNNMSILDLSGKQLILLHHHFSPTRFFNNSGGFRHRFSFLNQKTASICRSWYWFLWQPLNCNSLLFVSYIVILLCAIST